MEDPFLSRYQDGLRDLWKDAAVTARGHYDHVPTETAPGHATLVTGKEPDETGIIGNEWWDRDKKKAVTSVQDDKDGASPRRLRVPTVGDELKEERANARVVSISLKDRAAILLGGHHPDLVLWFDGKKAAFRTSPYYPHATPAWASDLNRQIKIVERGLAGDKPNKKKVARFLASSSADRWLGELARRAILNEHLGKRGTTDFLAISFSATDYLGHRVGPDSPLMAKHLKALDAVLGDVLRMLKSQGSDLDMILTSDHGVLPAADSETGKQLGARKIKSKTFVAQLNKHLGSEFHHRGKWVQDLDLPHLYLNPDLAAQTGLAKGEFLRRAAMAVRRTNDVAAAATAGEWDPADPYYDRYHRYQGCAIAGDLLVRLKPGVYVGDQKTGHGSPYDYDRWVPVLILSRHVKAVAGHPEIPMTSVAPILESLLELKGAAEKPIDAAAITENQDSSTNSPIRDR